MFYTLVDRELCPRLVDLAAATASPAGPARAGPACPRRGVRHAGRPAPGRPAPLDPSTSSGSRRSSSPSSTTTANGVRGSQPSRDRPDRGVPDVQDADLDVPRLSRLHGRQHPDRAPASSRPPELFPVDPWKVVGLTIDAERLARSATGACGHSRPGQRRGYAELNGDLRRAARRPRAAPPAGLSGDRRPKTGHRGVGPARDRAGRVEHRERQRGSPGLMATGWVYAFSEGDRYMRDLLGGKGAGWPR